MTLRRAVGHVVAIALACLWTFASQAHLTTRLTPDMAAAVDKTYKGMHKAYKPSGLSDEQLKYVFGVVGLVTAFLLMRRSSRALGLVMAMGIPLAGRIYPGMTVKGLEETHLAPALATMIVAAFGLGLLS